MMPMLESWAGPLLTALGTWALRWGAVGGLLVLWFAVRPPRRPAVRYLAGLAVLAAAPLLAILPQWGPGFTTIPMAEPSAVTAPSPRPPLASFTTFSRPTEPVAPEPAPAAVEPEWTWDRLWPVLVALGWLGGTGVMVLRLLLGCRQVRRWRRQARPAPADLLEAFVAAREELGLRRVVRLAVHPRLRSPVAVGGWRPAVLVPPDWAERPADVQRAGLLHELAHLARWDDVAKVAGELLRAPAFFHPLMHWLLARLDRERELLSDAAAVRGGVPRGDLARLLLDCACRHAGLPAPAAGPLPFLDARTLKVRIDQLLEANMERWIVPLSRRRAVVLACLALAVAAGLGTLRLGAAAQPPAKPPDPPAPALPGPQPRKEAPPVGDTQVHIRGKVVDDVTGQPVKDIVVQDGQADPQVPGGIRWGGGESMPGPTTKPGEFWTNINWGRGARYRVLAAGYVPRAVLDQAPAAGVKEMEVTVRLERGMTVNGTVTAANGQPVAGTAVFLVGARNLVIAGGKALGTMGDKETHRSVTRATTDAAGRFTLTGAGGDQNRLAISGPAPGLDLWLMDLSGFAGSRKDDPLPVKPPKLTLTLPIRLPEPAKLTVRYDIPGAAAKGRVFLQLHTWEMAGFKGVEYTPEVEVPNHGQLVLDNLPAGEYEVVRIVQTPLIETPNGNEIRQVFCDRRTVKVTAGQAVASDFARPQGARVAGTVTIKADGKAVPALLYVRPATATGNPLNVNEMFGPTFAVTTSGADGKFTTEQLAPGDYTLAAEYYSPPPRDPAGGLARLGRNLPALSGAAKVTVPAAGTVADVAIQLEPLKGR